MRNYIRFFEKGKKLGEEILIAKYEYASLNYFPIPQIKSCVTLDDAENAGDFDYYKVDSIDYHYCKSDVIIDIMLSGYYFSEEELEDECEEGVPAIRPPHIPPDQEIEDHDFSPQKPNVLWI